MVLAEGYILSSVLPDDVHVLLGFGEDGRLDKVPIIPDSVPTYICTVGTICFAGFDMAHVAPAPG